MSYPVKAMRKKFVSLVLFGMRMRYVRGHIQVEQKYLWMRQPHIRLLANVPPGEFPQKGSTPFVSLPPDLISHTENSTHGLFHPGKFPTRDFSLQNFPQISVQKLSRTSKAKKNGFKVMNTFG